MEQKYMDQSVELAAQNVKENGKPFGAVIVKDQKVLAIGVNDVVKEGDITAHAEIQAMRKAGKSFGEDSMKGAVMYASGHPCPMCLAAMHLAGFEKIYFNVPLEAVENTSLDAQPVYAELRKPFDAQKIPLIKLESNVQSDPVKEWLEANG